MYNSHFPPIDLFGEQLSSLNPVTACALAVVVTTQILSVCFLLAGLLKAVTPHNTVATLAAYRVLPRTTLTTVAKVLPSVEVALGIVLASGACNRVAVLIATAVLAVFTSVQVRNQLLGNRTTCGCFGPGSAVGMVAIIRNLLMLTICGGCLLIGSVPIEPLAATTELVVRVGTTVAAIHFLILLRASSNQRTN